MVTPAGASDGRRDRQWNEPWVPAPDPQIRPGPRHAKQKRESHVERVCFLARVRPDRLEEYRMRHENVWPEMRAALADAGWGNYTIFLADDGLLVGYLETDDYAAALAAMAKTEVNSRWQAEMAGYFLNVGGPGEADAPDQSFLRIPEIFHLGDDPNA